MRCYFNGDWSEFSGTINIGKNNRQNKKSYDPTFLFGNTKGLPLATVNVNDNARFDNQGKNVVVKRFGGKGALVVVDGAQSTPHKKVDVKDLGADFLAFSGHKLCGPMGIGVLYGKLDILERMPPFLRGGEMIEYVTRDDATYAEVPHKFEAGTVNASGAVGLAAAIRYIEGIGLEDIERNEGKLCTMLIERMKAVPHVHIIGNEDPLRHCGIVTFTIDGVHPHDIASILDTENIAIRAGHHCAQPLMQKLGVGSTARASLYFYNSESEVEVFAEKLSKVRSWMGIKE